MSDRRQRCAVLSDESFRFTKVPLSWGNGLETAQELERVWQIRAAPPFIDHHLGNH